MKLNLGCGLAPMDDAINHDRIKHAEHVDIAHDLDFYPWPWESELFETVYAMDVLEHLYNFMKALEECHRILKPKGKLHLQVPYAGNLEGFRDPTHIWHLMPDSLNYFINDTWLEKKYGYYSPMRWEVLAFQQTASLYWLLEKNA